MSRSRFSRPGRPGGGIRICALVLTFLAAAAPAAAARLDGRVLDPQGQPIAGATIELRAASGATRETRTDAAGRFALENLAAGSYRTRVTAPGFEAARFIQPIADDDVRRDVELELGTVMGEVVVTAALPELASGLDVTGRQLEQEGEDDLVEAFRGLRGLAAVRRGPINLEPVVRGLQENQLALFVDGTRTFAAGPARMDSDLSHVNPHMVESVRVVKGPYALAWGAGAMSAIELELYRPPFSGDDFVWQGGFGARYGENGERADGDFHLGGGGDRLRFYLGGGYRSGDDYRAGDGSEVPGEYQSIDSRVYFGFRPTEQLVIDYAGGFQDQSDIDYPGRILDASLFTTRSQDLELSWTGGGAITEIFGQLYVNRKDHLMNNDEKPTARPAPGRIPPFALRVALPTESNTAGGRLRVGFGRGDVEWNVGADGYRLEQNATREVRRRDNDFLIFEDVVWPDAELDNLGVYVQAVRRGDRYRLGATVRLDQVDATAGELSPFFRANTSGDPDRSEDNLSAAVSVAFELGERWQLRAGVGRSTRTATTLERYSDRFPATKFQLAAELMGNPALDPEIAHELDLGVGLVAGALRLQLDLFYRVIDDYITIVADPSLPRRLPLSPPVVFRYVNGTEAEFRGGELRVDRLFALGAHELAWRAEVGWTRGEDQLLDEPVLGIAPLEARVGVRWRDPGRRLWVDAAVRLADRQDRVARRRFEQETPGYAVYDLAAGWRLDGRWSLALWLENVADRAYADHLNAPNPFTRERILEPGRSARLAVELRY